MGKDTQALRYEEACLSLGPDELPLDLEKAGNKTSKSHYLVLAWWLAVWLLGSLFSYQHNRNLI